MAVNTDSSLAFEQALRHGADIGDHAQPVSFAVPPPRQLPIGPASLYGRDAELRQLDRIRKAHVRAVNDGKGAKATPMTVVITGPAGVGKSALATYWLRHAGPFPAGELRADFGSGHGRDKHPHEVIGRWLRLLDVPDDWIPAGVAERAAAWRSVTAGRQIAILVDDVPDLGTLDALLPGPGPAVLLATGSRIVERSADRAQVICLAGLVLADVLRMLGDDERTRPYATVHTARHLLAASGGRPLGLRLAIGILSQSSGLTASGMVAALNGLLPPEGLRNEALHGLAGLAYERLDAAEAKAWRLLALHPGPDFSVSLAAAALGCGPEAASRTLTRLERGWMLERTGADRYRHHELLRDVALGASRDAERTGTLHATQHRIAGFYLSSLAAAERLVPFRPASGRRDALPGPRGPIPAFGSAAEALEWLDQERANLRAVIQLAAKPKFRESHPAAAGQLADASCLLWRFRGTADEQIAVAEDATEHTCKLRDLEGAVRLRDLAGQGLMRRRDLDRALNAFTLGNQWWAAVSDHRGLTHLEHARGLAKAIRGKDEAAARHLSDAVACYRAAQDEWQAARALVDLAVPLVRLGHPRNAGLTAMAGTRRHLVERLRESLGVLGSDPFERARAMAALGTVLSSSEPDEAAESELYLKLALAEMERLSARPEQVRILLLLAERAERDGRPEQAAALRDRARACIPHGIELPDELRPGWRP